MQPEEKQRETLPKLRFSEFQDAPEWEEKRLEKVAPLQRGFDLPSHEIQPGDIPVVYSNGILNFHNQAMAKAPGLVTGRSGTIGKFHFIEEDYWPHNTSLWVTSFNSNHPKFIYYLYQTIGIERFATGSGVPTLNRNNVHAQQVLLPPSKKEQQKIADCLTSLDALIAAHSQKLAALRAYKKGLLQQLFPAEGETLPRRRFPEFQDAPAWVNSSLGEISTITSGGTPNRSKKEYWNGNIPWATTSLIDFNTIYDTSEYISELGLQESSAKFFSKNTILMAMYGQGKTRGKVAILGIEATTNQACAAILLKKKLQTNFVFQNLAGRYDEIRELSNRGGQENLSAKLIEAIPISYPQDLNEQQKIAGCLTSLDDLIAAQSQKIAALTAHKKGLLQQLFPAPDEDPKM